MNNLESLWPYHPERARSRLNNLESQSRDEIRGRSIIWIIRGWAGQGDCGKDWSWRIGGSPQREGTPFWQVREKTSCGVRGGALWV